VVKSIHIGARLRGESYMRAALGLVSRADPEERLILLAKPGVGVAARLLRRHFHENANAEPLKGV
jgi:hypothetical protein